MIFSLGLNPGQVQQADACSSPLPDETADTWFTDPPYYDAIGYAELSDFFYVWLKRTLQDHLLLQDPYDSSNPLTPKTRECVQDECYLSQEGKPKDKSFFEDTVAKAFTEGRRILKDNGIASTKLRKLTSYICHSCGSRNPVKSIDSRLRPAGMTEP